MNARIKTMTVDDQTVAFREAVMADRHFHLYVTPSDCDGRRFKAVVTLWDHAKPKGGWRVKIYVHWSDARGKMLMEFDHKFWTKKEAYEDALAYLLERHKYDERYEVPESKPTAEQPSAPADDHFVMASVDFDCHYANNCAPTVIASALGISLMNAHRELSKHGSHVPGRGAYMRDMKRVLEVNGRKCESEFCNYERRTGDSHTAPTMAQWLKTIDPGLYIVSNAGHVCLIHVKLNGKHEWLDNGYWSKSWAYQVAPIDALPKRIRAKYWLKISK